MADFRQIDDPQEVSRVYRQLFDDFGPQLFREKRRTLGAFLDIAPKLTKEARALQKAFDYGIPGPLLEAGQDKRARYALNAAGFLEKHGFSRAEAISLIENICIGLGTTVRLREYLPKDGKLPYEDSSGGDIYKAVKALDHIRYFLNHQNSYIVSGDQEKINALRTLMNDPVANNARIRSEYEGIVKNFQNDPYETWILLDKTKDGKSIHAGCFDDYFVVLDGTPVPVGFARQFAVDEKGPLFRSFDLKKEAFLKKAEGIRQKIDAAAVQTSSADKGGASGFILWSVIFGVALVFLMIEHYLKRDFSWLMENLRISSQTPADKLNQLITNPAMRQEAVRGLLFVAAALFLVMLVSSIFGTISRSSANKKAMNVPAEEKQKLLYLMDQDVMNDIRNIELLINDKNAGASPIYPHDYREMLSHMPDLEAVQKKTEVVSTEGRRLRLLVFAMAVVFLLTRQGVILKPAAGRESGGSQTEEGGNEIDTGRIERISKSEMEAGAQQLVPLRYTQSSYCSNDDRFNVLSAIDDDDSTCWQEGASGVGIGEYIVLTYDQNYTVEYILVKPGDWGLGKYYQNSRPRMLRFLFDNDVVYSYEFNDSIEEYILHLPKTVTTRNVTVYIDSAYDGNVYQDTAINKVALYGY